MTRRTLAAMGGVLAMATTVACTGDGGPSAPEKAASDDYATATTVVGEQPDGRAEGGYGGEDPDSVEDLVRLSAAVVDGTIVSVERGEVAGPPDDLIQPRLIRVRINGVVAGDLDANEIEVVDGYWNAGPEYFGSYSQDGSRFGQVGERAFMFITPDATGELWHLFLPSTRFFIDRGDLVRNVPDDGHPVVDELARLDAAGLVERVHRADRALKAG